jgi:hypothetical protein
MPARGLLLLRQRLQRLSSLSSMHKRLQLLMIWMPQAWLLGGTVGCMHL